MKIGDYVRTEYGISKIIGIFPERTMVFIETDNGLGNCNSSQNGKLRKGIVILEEDYRNFIDNNVKERPIDLIEVGDYVNGYKVLEIEKDYLFDYREEFNVLIVQNDEVYEVAKKIYSDNIKSIVTKEQFESIKYKV